MTQGRGLDEVAGIGQHRAPFRSRRLRAKAKKAKGGGIENGVGNAKGAPAR